MIKWKKYICVALSAVMMASLATGCGDTNDSSSSDKAEATTESESDTLLMKRSFTESFLRQPGRTALSRS